MITNYIRAPFYKSYREIFEDTYSKEWESISEFNIYPLEHLRAALGIDTKPTVISSEMDLRDEPNGRLIDICKAVGADTYLAGPDGTIYMDLGAV